MEKNIVEIKQYKEPNITTVKNIVFKGSAVSFKKNVDINLKLDNLKLLQHRYKKFHELLECCDLLSNNIIMKRFVKRYNDSMSSKLFSEYSTDEDKTMYRGCEISWDGYQIKTALYSYLVQNKNKLKPYCNVKNSSDVTRKKISVSKDKYFGGIDFYSTDLSDNSDDETTYHIQKNPIRVNGLKALSSSRGDKQILYYDIYESSNVYNSIVDELYQIINFISKDSEDWSSHIDNEILRLLSLKNDDIRYGLDKLPISKRDR